MARTASNQAKDKKTTIQRRNHKKSTKHMNLLQLIGIIAGIYILYQTMEMIKYKVYRK